ncbi:MAG TPA: lipoprotein [Micromonosporaceae bacterium]|jgi:hypothetical protein|nr:lipoprotein [Micromonosporaceae bacterium]
MKRVLLTAVIALSVAGCSAHGGTANRPALHLPDPSAFTSGTCSTIADPVLALGHFTYDKATARLTDADRAELVVQGEKLKAARESAEPALADQMMDVLMHIGFVRIRPGKAYDPQLLADVETARQRLQGMCTT